MSHLVITLVVLSIANLKCGSMLGGQVNPMISIIIDNNSNDNYSTELFSAPISQVGGGKCLHQLRPSGFQIFVGSEFNSF